MFLESILSKIPQFARNQRHRHFWSVMQHGTPLKWWNLIHVEMERKLRKVRVGSRPYLLILDPCNLCNLRCPLCPTGLRQLPRKQGKMTFEQFRQIFDKFVKHVFEVILHNWGEPLMNEDIYHMIQYAQSRNVGTNLSSNFVLLKSSDIDALIDSGLEYLVVSLDATSPEVYNQYRIGGDYNRVVDNMKLLLKRRKERKSKTPVVEWQFIVMSVNQHQVEQAAELSKQIGVDLLRFIPVGLLFDAPNKSELARQWFPRQGDAAPDWPVDTPRYGQKMRYDACGYLYRSMVINPDGGISPCCVVYDEKYDFGKIQDHDPRHIWNNEYYLSARSLFSENKATEMKPTACQKCTKFEKRKRRK